MMHMFLITIELDFFFLVFLLLKRTLLKESQTATDEKTHRKISS